MKKQTILLLVQEVSERVGTIFDHIKAIECGIDGVVIKTDSVFAKNINLSLYDIVILHYSLVISMENYIPKELKKNLQEFKGLTVLFIQDEYRWINKTAEAMRDLGVNVVFSLVSPDSVRKVYHHEWCDQIRFEYTLTGFVPAQLTQRKVPAYEDRKLVAAYRARKLSAWYGHHTMQKWQIAERFLADAKKYQLAVDISTSEDDRIYGDDWIDFMASAKVALGTESGASVCDFTGEIQKNVEAHLLEYPDATYEELKALYFQDADGQIVMNVISPRCFEAACLRNLMVMYPGEYGDILVPGRHYVVLEQDHSNIEDVLKIVNDTEAANKIIQTTYEEIVLSGRWSYQSLSNHLKTVIFEETRGIRTSNSSILTIKYDKWRAIFLSKIIILNAKLAILKWKIRVWVVMLPGKIAFILKKYLPEAIYSAVKPHLKFIFIGFKNTLKFFLGKPSKEK